MCVQSILSKSKLTVNFAYVCAVISSSRLLVVQIKDFGDFLHEYLKEKSETFTEF